MNDNQYIFGAPGRYIQGPGAIKRLGEYIRPLGGRVLVVGGKTGLSETRDGRIESFKNNSIRQFEELFNGEVCEAEIKRLVRTGKSVGCEVMLASGGGKAIDAVKAAAEELEIPAIIVPTIAGSDAPCSALSVIYKDDGSFSHLMILKKSPALVLVDTEIIARSPVRLLVSGMGDAIATLFEVEACRRAGALNNFGGRITSTSLALSKLCFETLLECGREAKRNCEDNLVTDALGRVVEANTLLSGLGFESGGVALAHAIAETFTSVPEMIGYTHGEKVAFGLLAQLIAEERPSGQISEIYKFFMDVGLPVTLGELGLTDINSSLLHSAANEAAAPNRPSHNLKSGITGEEIYDAVIKADAMGRDMKSKRH